MYLIGPNAVSLEVLLPMRYEVAGLCENLLICCSFAEVSDCLRLFCVILIPVLKRHKRRLSRSLSPSRQRCLSRNLGKGFLLELPLHKTRSILQCLCLFCGGRFLLLCTSTIVEILPLRSTSLSDPSQVSETFAPSPSEVLYYSY